MAVDEGKSQNGDPFERALAREEAYRRRRGREAFSPSGVFSAFRWLALGFAAAWGGLLALHWTMFSDPRWLVVMHTMVYGVVLIYFVTMLIAFAVMQKRPGAFGLTDEDA